MIICPHIHFSNLTLWCVIDFSLVSKEGHLGFHYAESRVMNILSLPYSSLENSFLELKYEKITFNFSRIRSSLWRNIMQLSSVERLQQCILVASFTMMIHCLKINGDRRLYFIGRMSRFFLSRRTHASLASSQKYDVTALTIGRFE